MRIYAIMLESILCEIIEKIHSLRINQSMNITTMLIRNNSDGTVGVVSEIN